MSLKGNDVKICQMNSHNIICKQFKGSSTPFSLCAHKYMDCLCNMMLELRKASWGGGGGGEFVIIKVVVCLGRNYFT